jgi:hypothetical protein
MRAVTVTCERSILTLVSTWLVLACSSSTPEAEGPETMETGSACAPAEIVCDPIHCTAEIENRCDKPVTCKLFALTYCRPPNGNQGPATATSEQQTVLPRAAKQLQATLSCGNGIPTATRVDKVECF